ncbi:MAG: NAD(+) diphosphatase [Armatimonadota bacterium]
MNLGQPGTRRAYPPERPAQGDAWWIPIVGSDGIVLDAARKALVRGTVAEAPDNALFIAEHDGLPVLAWRRSPSADDDQAGSGEDAIALREVVARLPEGLGHLVGYACQLVDFRKQVRWCAACGGALRDGELWSRQCVECGRGFWPPATPAVLLLIHDGADRILLAQKPGWGTRWSIIAGFVEPGESLEACCCREALEEVGVAVEDCTYVGSQPWPFPHQLMIAFEARHVSGEIVPDPGELADARWFHVDALPDLPPRHALSRRTIELWRARRRP